MIHVKPILAILMTAAGGVATGGALYLGTQRPVLTEETAAPWPSRPAPDLRIAGVAARPAPRVTVLAPVLIRALPAPRTVSRRAVAAPCSEWQSMATGPAGRRVRSLCPR